VTRRLFLYCFVTVAFTFVAHAQTASATHKTQRIIFLMTDGLRWQEVFNGADLTLMSKENGGVADPEPLKKLYWRDDLQARREALMPFLWTTVAKQGQLYGNRALQSDAYVTNGLNFSYPGYNETLTGFADPRINSNDKNLNPNVTVFEWLNQKPAFHGKVAAFGAWDCFPFIFNAQRSGLFVNAGFDPLRLSPTTPQLDLLNQLKSEEPPFLEEEPVDAITFRTALEYLKLQQPKVLYISLGETDEWAHKGDYPEYLGAAHRADAYLKALWETVQSLPAYRGKTTLIFSPDHGRGDDPLGWKDHGEKVPQSKYIWMVFLGPDTAALGERSHIRAVTQSQIAATLAALLGEDYNAAVSKAGAPIRDVLAR
jgi:hypothetical protein